MTTLEPPPLRGLTHPVAAASLVVARRARAEELRRRHGLRLRAVADGALRAVDVLVVLAVAPLALLVVLVAAVAIVIDDPGPVFFRQSRTGRDGRRFRLWKLRTMSTDAESRLEELRAQSLVAWPIFKMDRDPRITRVGRVLRKLNLDEVPQLWNVLKGDMALVGPRPTSAPADSYVLWQTARLSARPGLTGAWQVTPRKDQMPFDDRVRVDIRHMRTRTFSGDVRLIMRTVARPVCRAQGM